MKLNQTYTSHLNIVVKHYIILKSLSQTLLNHYDNSFPFSSLVLLNVFKQRINNINDWM